MYISRLCDGGGYWLTLNSPQQVHGKYAEFVGRITGGQLTAEAESMHHSDRPNLTAKMSMSEEPAPGRAEHSGLVPVIAPGGEYRQSNAHGCRKTLAKPPRSGRSTRNFDLWLPLRGCVRAEIAARDIKRGAIAAELGLTGGTLNRMLAKRPVCRASQRSGGARLARA